MPYAFPHYTFIVIGELVICLLLVKVEVMVNVIVPSEPVELIAQSVQGELLLDRVKPLPLTMLVRVKVLPVRTHQVRLGVGLMKV